jgi:branched-chain amino acid transport system permease protein
VGWQTAALVVILLLLVVYPWVFNNPFPQHIMITVFLYATLGSAWNILGGFTGQISIGQAAYFGLGAYTSTLLFMRLGVSPWLGMLGGIVVAVVVGTVIGYITFRLGGRYFSMATLVIAEILRTVFTNWNFVGGAVGLFVPLLPDSFVDFQFHASKIPYYYIILAFLVITLVATHLVTRSRLGYYFKAIRNDPVAAQSLGINITKYKLIALAISLVFTAIGGTFYAQYVLFIDPPSMMRFQVSLMTALVAILGGMGDIWGPTVGALVLIPTSELTRAYFGGGGRNFDFVVFGALIIIVAVVRPEGLLPTLRQFARRLSHGSAGSD